MAVRALFYKKLKEKSRYTFPVISLPLIFLHPSVMTLPHVYFNFVERFKPCTRQNYRQLDVCVF